MGQTQTQTTCRAVRSERERKCCSDHSAGVNACWISRLVGVRRARRVQQVELSTRGHRVFRLYDEKHFWRPHDYPSPPPGKRTKEFWIRHLIRGGRASAGPLVCAPSIWAGSTPVSPVRFAPKGGIGRYGLWGGGAGGTLLGDTLRPWLVGLVGRYSLQKGVASTGGRKSVFSCPLSFAGMQGLSIPFWGLIRSTVRLLGLEFV